MSINDYPVIVEKLEHSIIMGVLLRVKVCPKCGKYIKPEILRYLYGNNMFHDPEWAENSHVKVDGYPICKECANKNLADFLCELCHTRKPTSKIQESFGDPPEFLCQDCYKTTPAAIWCDKVEDLEGSHRYDFE